MKPMLAAHERIDTAALRYPVFASQKLDGIRALVVDGKLLSRTFTPIPNLHAAALFGRPELNGYDGELIVGDPTASNVCRVTGSATSREKWKPDVKFYVFDNFAAPGGFHARYETLRSGGGVVIVPQHLMHSEAELLAFEDETLAAGYEGLIVRAPSGPYKHGRSTVLEGWMLKVKRFVDAEAVVVEVLEEMHNANPAGKDAFGRTKRSTAQDGMVGTGTTGSLRCIECDTGTEFTLGVPDTKTGAEFWKNRDAIAAAYFNGAPVLVKFKHFAYGRKDAPRQPGYRQLLGIRPNWDVEYAALAGKRAVA